MNKRQTYDPLADLHALQRQFFGDDWSSALTATTIPTTDVYTKDNQLVVEAHLPHFDQQDVDISVQNGALVLQAERHETQEDKSKKYVVRETSSSFYRRIQLPERADTDTISAHLDDGVLKIHVPLVALPDPKKIAVTGHKKPKA